MASRSKDRQTQLCAHEDCNYLVHEDPDFHEFCCRKCSASLGKAPQHGEKCQKKSPPEEPWLKQRLRRPDPHPPTGCSEAPKKLLSDNESRDVVEDGRDDGISVYEVHTASGLMYCILASHPKHLMLQYAANYMQEALDVGPKDIDRKDLHLGTTSDWQKVLLDNLRSKFPDQCFELATVVTGKWRDLQAIGIASNKKTRERASNLALAVAVARGKNGNTLSFKKLIDSMKVQSISVKSPQPPATPPPKHTLKPMQDSTPQPPSTPPPKNMLKPMQGSTPPLPAKYKNLPDRHADSDELVYTPPGDDDSASFKRDADEETFDIFGTLLAGEGVSSSGTTSPAAEDRKMRPLLARTSNIEPEIWPAKGEEEQADQPVEQENWPYPTSRTVDYPMQPRAKTRPVAKPTKKRCCPEPEEEPEEEEMQWQDEQSNQAIETAGEQEIQWQEESLGSLQMADDEKLVTHKKGMQWAQSSEAQATCWKCDKTYKEKDDLFCGYCAANLGEPEVYSPQADRRPNLEQQPTASKRLKSSASASAQGTVRLGQAQGVSSATTQCQALPSAWVCSACNFRNWGRNTVCGGIGHMGCKTLRKQADETLQKQEERGRAKQPIAYLPKEMNGKVVLENVGANMWRATNDFLKGDASGLPYKRTKKSMLFQGKLLEKGGEIEWGATTQGIDDGDGWVRVNNPKALVWRLKANAQIDQALPSAWVCSACNFKNSGRNTVCGGTGHMGCKTLRKQADETLQKQEKRANFEIFYLRELLRAHDISESEISKIQEKERMHSIEDFAFAPNVECEEDARDWAKELGFEGRVPVGRFVAAWLAARNAVQKQPKQPSAPPPAHLQPQLPVPPPPSVPPPVKDGETTVMTLEVNSVWALQASVAPTFTNGSHAGQPLGNLIHDLRNRTVDPFLASNLTLNVLAACVVDRGKKQWKYYANDHRRLWCMHMASCTHFKARVKHHKSSDEFISKARDTFTPIRISEVVVRQE